jgi:hypothetical protein
VIETPYLNADEAAAYLKFKNARSLYKAIPVNGIPFKRRGPKTLLFDRRELDRWLAGERVRHGRSLSLVKGQR